MASPVPTSTQGKSPTRPRSESPRDSNDTAGRVGHSVTQVTQLRSPFNPNDSKIRERQRTMDVGMAVQLSRARQETLQLSPTTPADHTPYDLARPHPHPSQPPQEHTPPDLSVLPPDSEDTEQNPDISLEDITSNKISIQPSKVDNFQHVDKPHDASFLAPLAPSSPPNSNEGGSIPNHGLLSVQANISGSHFDFSPMEEYAAAEKQRLDSAPPTVARPSSGGLLVKASSNEVSTPGSGKGGQPEGGPSQLQRLRIRKLSTSNPKPHRRKGVGAKVMFSKSSSEKTPPGQSGPVPASDEQAEISGDNLPGVPTGFSGVPSGGILNTGRNLPYRFSFYSNSLSATIHSRSLSELPAEGQSFEQLFLGINSSDGAPLNQPAEPLRNVILTSSGSPNKTSPDPAGLSDPPPTFAKATSFEGINASRQSFGGGSKMGQPFSYICDSNTWWLNVQNPTDDEMKMLSKVFSIHPLTTEDILMEEAREKIELFQNYYLVCFRSFNQDPYSPTYLEPVNMYIIVFREGILSFHFGSTPHPQNVRRRIKQLKDYISVTSDWISYALIDDITDAFGPLIQGIEYEVDSIDELVLILRESEQDDMLLRIGRSRKKVMGLSRLMGNKADVVGGLARRCNENWKMAPTSDIGLYLSDIQDHLITMTQNLNHYETILSRSHSNYLAQISIDMTNANSQMNDVLSKLTALGTVLVPMNLVTSLWGMNVRVPGQGSSTYTWFVSIIACLVAFSAIGGYSTYRLMVKR